MIVGFVYSLCSMYILEDILGNKVCVFVFTEPGYIGIFMHENEISMMFNVYFAKFFVGK